MDSVKSITPHMEIMIHIKPVIKSGFAPYLSYILPVIGDKKALITAPGNKSKPDSKAVKPRPFCK